MTDPIEPTAAKEPVTEPTAAQPKEPEKLFKTFASKKEHDDYINEITKERLDRERKKFADYDDLIVYREGKGGQRIESKNHKGGRRKITRLYWWA